MSRLPLSWSRCGVLGGRALLLAALSACMTLEVNVTSTDPCCCDGGDHGGDGASEISDIPEDSTTVSWKMNDTGKWYPTVRVTATGLKTAGMMEGTDLTHKWAVYGDVGDSSTLCSSNWFPDSAYLLVGEEETDPAKTEWVVDIELDFLEMDPGEWVSLDIILVANISTNGSHNARMYHICDQAPPGLPMSESP